jgi:hypothetical protein
MFRRRRFSGEIVSDEGYSVAVGRDWLTYQRGGRRLSATVDVGGPGVTIFVDMVNRWDDDLSHEIDKETQASILNDIRAALAWQGLEVTFRP